MDGDTIVAGLLHDTVEDTALTLQQLEARGSARRPALEMMRRDSVERDESPSEWREAWFGGAVLEMKGADRKDWARRNH
jgi:hypothetical protein